MWLLAGAWGCRRRGGDAGRSDQVAQGDRARPRGAGRPRLRAAPGGGAGPAAACPSAALRPAGRSVRAATRRRRIEPACCAAATGRRPGVGAAMIAASLGVFGYAAGAVVLSWAYFRRCRMTRPPLGVFNLADVLIMLVGVVLVPYLYVALPTWLVGALLGGLTVGILYVTLEPFPVPRRAIWLGILVLVAADLAGWLRFGGPCKAFADTKD